MLRALLCLFLLSTVGLHGQSAFTLQATTRVAGEGIDGPHATLRLDMERFRTALSAKRAHLELPLPDGTFAQFLAENSPVLAPALAARYPRIGSYRVRGPWGEGRVAISHKGVDALLRGPGGTYAIQPAEDGLSHLVFYSRDYTGEDDVLPLGCGYDPADPLNLSGLDLEHKTGAGAGAKITQKSFGEARELRQYDLAFTNTGEFAKLVGGTKEDVLAAFNTAVSTINAIFEREVGVRMNLLALSEQLIYLDGATDPFSDADEGRGLLDQVVTAFQIAEIPATVYDLGHIFTSRCVDVGGVVSGLACSGSKTRGVTCLQGNNIARTAERVLAHEIAHQFTVSHSWNNCPSSQEQRAGNTAFEPGSGTTIMSYAGACGDQNIGGEDAYYHVGSLEQFLFYTREGGASECATVIETDNVTPDVILDYEDGFFIPKSTPFRLTGTATDANDPASALTYTWEQYDLGPIADIDDPKGTAPTFRSVPPSQDGFTRYFPRVSRVANNISSNDEVLPDYAREMTFRLTARDNNPQAGAVGWATVNFETAEVGPFLVNDPALEENAPWRVGEYREVTWDVAGTDGAPVFARRVNVLLSGDGGLTFDQVLASNVANTGSAFITVPDSLGESMRIIVEAAENIFYNMNARDFRIAAATQATYTLESDLRYEDVCLPEVLTANLTVGSVLGYDQPVTLSFDSAALADNLGLRLERTQLLPGQTTTLTIDLSGVTASGRIVVPVVITAPGLETSRREIVLDLIANDFSDLTLGGPAEGTEGIGLTTTFDWTPSINAAEYEIQVATSPSFAPGTVVESATGLTETEFEPVDFFAPNDLYFWRVRPVNACGPGPWTETASFRTVSSRCDVLSSTDTPVGLPGSGGAFTRESKLFVDRRGNINDLNVPNVTVNYQFASKVSLTLTSPAGTAVKLYTEKCFSTNTINLGFDDDAPIAVACPPDDKRVFQAEGDLSAFNGEDTFGEWILTISVSETNGAAGQIAGWSVEFCADATAAKPQTVVNEPTEVMPLGRNAILRSELEIFSTTDEANETFFLLTRLPARGLLELGGTTLMLGDSFSQDDINRQRVVYESVDTSLMTDDFGFVVNTVDGGYLPVTAHDIILTADAINATGPLGAVEASLSVFPNPTAGDVNLRWKATNSQAVTIELYDAHGRRIREQATDLNAGAATLSTDGLPSGLYLLRMQGAIRRIVVR